MSDPTQRQPQHKWAVRSWLVFALLQGCGDAPPLPDDEDHRDATVDQCIECHVADDSKRPPSGHFEDGEIKEKKRDCYECHAPPE